ncbi:MAG TPA: ABC transporter substrate-binding protein [Clostridia bacterium]|nr:ABC transporter substrate-binding protein [Clostridia bacterium]
MKKALALLLAVFMAATMMAACQGTTPGAEETLAPETTPGGTTETPAPTEAAEPQTVVVRAYGDPLTLNPDTTGDDFNYAVAQNVYNRMVKLDASKQIIPDLARTWETSADGLQITFHLAENVYWHDGEKFTSEDVKYTFETIASDNTLIAHDLFKNLDHVECPDENTAVFVMKTPDVSIIGYLGWYGTFVLPQHLFDNGQPWSENPASESPIGTGPFKFVSYTPAVSIDLEKNENYWETEVKLDQLIFKIIPDNTTAVQALRTGEIDYMEAVPNTEVASLQTEGFSATLNVYPSPMYILFNFRDGYDTPLAVRQAIAYCIDRADINTKVFSGVREPEYHFYPSIIEWACNTAVSAPEYDVQQAIAALEAAGYTKDADGYYVRGLQIEVYNLDNAPDVARLIAAACKEAGIELTVNAQEYLAWDQTVNELSGSPGTFCMALMGGFQGPDPSALANRIGTTGMSNLGKYTNAEIDQLLAEGNSQTDQAYRQERYFRVQEIMSQELPIIPVIAYAEYVCFPTNLRGTPVENAGIGSWGEFTFCYFE